MSGIFDDDPKEGRQETQFEGRNLLIVIVLVAMFAVISIAMFLILPQLMAELPPYYP